MIDLLRKNGYGKQGKSLSSAGIAVKTKNH